MSVSEEQVEPITGALYSWYHGGQEHILLVGERSRIRSIVKCWDLYGTPEALKYTGPTVAVDSPLHSEWERIDAETKEHVFYKKLFGWSD